MSSAGRDPQLRNTVGRALGRVPSGVFVLSARDGPRTLGMLCSWVQQAAFDPPAVSLAIAKDRPIRPAILATRRLAISVLAEGDMDLMRRFARPRPGPGDDAFDGAETIAAPSGLPVLARALAWLDCELIDTLDVAADHEIFVARVAAGEVLRQGPSFTHVRGNGFHY